MILNLGGGDERIAGAITVDLRPECADVVADVGSLPFPDGSAEEIYALDVLEHIPAARTDAVLAEWRRVLRPTGGRLVVRVPNMLMLSQWLVEGRQVEAVIRNIYGGHRWGPDGAYDAHHHGWTPELFERDLQRNDFTVMENDMQLNMTVVAA